MKYYLAPLEGLTTHIYRNAVEKYFPGIDRYFTPFISPDQNRILRTKETRDVIPENNQVKDLVPQILTNDPEHFYRTADALLEMGYEEVNLNFGCPSGTVVSKNRGSGILAYPDQLDAFLEQIFYDNSIRISVKTRIGRDDVSEAERLMKIYRRYPLTELIIHPRTRQEFYHGTPHVELFGELLQLFADSKLSICYNGNLLTQQDVQMIQERFPKLDSLMFGRGMIANPGLISQIVTGKPMKKDTFLAFHDEVLEGYRQVFGEDRNALFRMKEMWIYLLNSFEDSEKYGKKIRKSQNLTEYRIQVEQLLKECALLSQGPKFWKLPGK